MKKIFSLLLLFVCLNVCAQDSCRTSVSDLFLSMPDSLMPLLPEKGRKDIIDFYNKMEAKVRNVYDDYVELEQLDQDFLALKTSERSSLTLRLLETNDSVQVVALVRTVRSSSADSQVEFYNQRWQRLHWLDFPHPSVADFCSEVIPDSLQETMQQALLMLEELKLVEVTASAELPEFELVLQTTELPQKEREAAESMLHPLRYVWTGEEFSISPKR